MPKNLLCFIFLIICCGSSFSQEYSLEELQKMTLEELLSVTVTTPSKHGQKLWESSSQVTVITRDEIEAYGYADLFELFQSIVGSLVSDEGNRYIIGLRALPDPSTSNSRFLFLIDGHVMNDSYFQRSFPSDRMGINIKNVSRVEIVRGPGSVLYGSSAFQGIINVVTEKSSDAGIDASISTGGVVGDAGGSHTGKSTSLLNQYCITLRTDKSFNRDNDLYLAGSVSDDEGQLLNIPYFTSTGQGAVVEKVDFHKTNSVMLKYRFRNLRVQGGYSQSSDGLPLADYGADPGSKNNKTKQQQFFTDVKWEQNFSDKVSGFLRAYVDFNGFDGYWQYDSDPSLDHQQVETEKAGMEIQTQYSLHRNLIFAGIEGQGNKAKQVENYPSESYSNTDHFSFNSFGIYLQDEYNLSERWILTAGGRIEMNRQLGPVLLARGSVIYNSRKNSIYKLIYADGFKNPLLHDYYYHSSILNEKNYDITELQPERVKNLELVYNYKKAALQTEWCLFLNEKLKLITLNNNFDYYQNSASMLGYGMEFIGTFRFSPHQKCYLNGIIQKNKFTDSVTIFYNTPDYSIKAGSVVMLLKDEKLNFAIELQHYGFADFEDSNKRPGIDFKQNPFVLVNCNILSKDILPGIQLSLKLNNLLNTTYFYPLAKGVAQPYPGKGFNFRLSLRYIFSGIN